jgi:hypothetical protein
VRDVYAAIGFRSHPATGQVPLHHRDAHSPRYLGLWSGSGGKGEPINQDDPLAAWRSDGDRCRP